MSVFSCDTMAVGLLLRVHQRAVVLHRLVRVDARCCSVAEIAA